MVFGVVYITLVPVLLFLQITVFVSSVILHRHAVFSDSVSFTYVLSQLGLVV